MGISKGFYGTLRESDAGAAGACLEWDNYHTHTKAYDEEEEQPER
jgi:hypothetical protein